MQQESSICDRNDIGLRPNDLSRAVFYGRGNRMASIEGLGMNEVQTGASSALFGSWRHTSVSRGLDTFDANTTLGFDDDERDYGIAARMLRMLDCTRIVLLTNNPAKLEGLTKAGIEIASRMPLDAPVNADNHRYMAAKAERAGHSLTISPLR